MITAASKKYFGVLMLFLTLLGVLHFYSFSPVHDTFVSYQAFNLMYSGFFHNGEILSWFPFTSYGLNADWYFLNCMTVFKYFFIAIGSLLRIPDAMLFFKMAMFFEEMVFVLGVYLLSRDLFKRGETVLFVCICAAGSVVITNQAGINFYAYYLLPLAIYCLRRFFYERTVWYLPLAASIVFLSVPGQAVYFLVVFFVEMLIIFVALMAHHFREWRGFLRAPGKETALAVFFLVCCVALLFSIIYGSFAPLEHLRTLSTGRDVVTRHTSLDVFLTYGGQVGFEKFIDFVYPAVLRATGSIDVTLYVGLLSLPFVIYALIKVRDPLFKGFTAVVIVLTLFSLGGYFSTIMYYGVPGMKYFRHIGLSVGSFKLFIPLMAGFGLDYFLCHSRLLKHNALIPRLIVGVLLLAGATSCYFASQGFVNLSKAAVIYLAIAAVVSIFVTVRKNFAAGLLIALCVEMLGFQVLVHEKFQGWMPVEPPSYFRTAEKIEFPPVRTMFVANERGQELLPYFRLLFAAPFAINNCIYNFLQWDSCNNEFRADFTNKYVAAMIEARGGVARNLNIWFPSNDNILLSAIGCGTLKLRLASNVAFAGTEQQGIQMLQANSNGEMVILNGVPEQIRSSWVNYGMSGGDVKVTGFTYNSLDAEAVVPEPFGVWLYYADAYHPSWRALINSKPAPVYQANTGFKAIFLPNGKSSVRFFFENAPAIRWSSYCIIVSGLIFTVACLIWGIRLVFQTIKSNHIKTDYNG